jgi:hypothetical protein
VRTLITLAAGAILITSCVKKIDNSSDSSGYVTEGKSALWPDGDIPVCWEPLTDEKFRDGYLEPSDELDEQPGTNPSNEPPSDIPPDDDAPSGDAGDGEAFSLQATKPSEYPMPSLVEIKEYRGLVQSALLAQFNGRTKIKFSGFGECQAASKGIRLALRIQAANVEAFGRFLDGMADGVKLPFYPKTRMGEDCGGGERRSVCIKGIALHEMGHAIGLRHEANRPDGNCPDDQTGGKGEDGAIMVGAFDKRSIMNYCWNRAQIAGEIEPELSAGDIETINKYYSGGVKFPDVDKAVECEKRKGSWNSVGTCCNATVADATEAARLPFQYCKDDQSGCIVSGGKWNTTNFCCDINPAPPQPRNFMTCEETKLPQNLPGDVPNDVPADLPDDGQVDAP